MKVLVSFCNRTQFDGVFLAEVDLTTEAVRLVPSPDPIGKSFSGIAGLRPWRDGYVAVLQPNGIVPISRDLSFGEAAVIPDLRDGHSVWPDGDSLLVVSSGNDTLLRLWGDRSEVVWRPSQFEDADTLHLNSVTVAGKDILVSMFGHSPSESWLDARDGCVLDIRSHERLTTGLHHPHSLYAHDGGWWVCSSLGGYAVREDGRRVSVANGYVRGFAISGSTIVAGSSHFRLRSRSTGRELHLDPSINLGLNVAGLEVFEAESTGGWRQVKFMDLSAVANEIYDIVVLS